MDAIGIVKPVPSAISRADCGPALRLLGSLAFCVLTGLSAQLRVPLPCTPVPVTAQVLAVMLSGLCLGPWFGALSQVLYLAAGVAGLSWFSGAASGIALPSFGYVAGFAFMSMTAAGAAAPGISPARRLLVLMGSVAVLYTFGVVWLGIALRLSPGRAVMLGAVPFIPFDILKAAMVLGPARALASRGSSR